MFTTDDGRQVASRGAVGGWDSEAGGSARVFPYNTMKCRGKISPSPSSMKKMVDTLPLTFEWRGE